MEKRDDLFLLVAVGVAVTAVAAASRAVCVVVSTTPTVDYANRPVRRDDDYANRPFSFTDNLPCDCLFSLFESQ